MAGFQFAHIEVYARSVSKLKGAQRAAKGSKRDASSGGWSARDILAEALREADACHHVDAPQPPEVLMGDLQQLADELDREPPVKGQRKDTPILLAGVASAPWPPGDPRSAEWRLDTIEHLRQEWGDRLRCVVGHNDEAHDHLHFYVTAPNWGPVKGLHPGYAARRAAAEAEETKDSPKAQKRAYDAAMRAWQDRYAAIASQHGMTRFGPGRRRLTTAQWNDEQRAAEQTAKLEARAKATAESVKTQAAEARGLLERAQAIRAEVVHGLNALAELVAKHATKFKLDELAEVHKVLAKFTTTTPQPQKRATSEGAMPSEVPANTGTGRQGPTPGMR